MRFSITAEEFCECRDKIAENANYAEPRIQKVEIHLICDERSYLANLYIVHEFLPSGKRVNNAKHVKTIKIIKTCIVFVAKSAI